MPQAQPNPPQPSLADQWAKLNSEQRQTALSRMTPDQKGQLASALGFRSSGTVEPNRAPAPRQQWSMDRFLAPANEKANPSQFDPNTLSGYGARTGQALKGIASSVTGMFDLRSIPGGEDNPIIWNPATQFKKDWQGIKDWNELRKANPDYAWGSILGPMLLTHTVSGLIEPAGITAKLARGTGVDPAYIEPIVADLRAAAKGDKSWYTPRGAWEFVTKKNKPKTVGDFVELANKAQKGLNQEYAASLGKFSNFKSNLPDANGNFPISQAIKALKEKMPAITDADRAERAFVDKAAAEYQKPISLGELDLKRMQANNRLTAYYDKNDVSQYATESRNAQIAVDKTVADWVRDNVYPEMDQLTGKPAGYFRNLKARVGNLMNASSQAKEFAAKVHRESAVERGSTPMERVHPGGAISLRGSAHGYLSNLPAAIKPPNPEGAANAAVRSAFSLRNRLPAPRKAEILSVPLSAITSAMQPAQNPTDAWAGTAAP